ncbi:MAG: YicC family protein [Chitinivibrionales bacterium]|nr:YicC family protein [Chitinivibrionales bacterium]
MALRSMTGFGQAESVTPTGTYRVEIRAVNNRFLDLQLRLPKTFATLEQKVRQTVSEAASRGSVTVMVNYTGGEGETRLTWDRQAVNSYMRLFREVIEEQQLNGGVTLSDLLQFTDLIKAETAELSEKDAWRDLRPVLSKALESFAESRAGEGRHTERDLRAAVRGLSAALKKIERRAPVRLKTYQKELRQRIQSVVDKTDVVDESRIATEVAMMADKLDIAEECARLRAHIDKFLATLDADEPVGKHLGFLLQEMNRESNTICSKANDAQISHWGVELKEYIERLREQIQNIE